MRISNPTESAKARAADGEALTGPWAVADARRNGRLCGRRGFARGRVRQAAVVESRPSGACVFWRWLWKGKRVAFFPWPWNRCWHCDANATINNFEQAN